MPVTFYPDGTTVFTGARATRFYRLLVLRTLLRFEIAGIPGRRNPFPAVETALDQFDRLPEGKPPHRRSDRARAYMGILQELITEEREALRKENEEPRG